MLHGEDLDSDRADLDGLCFLGIVSPLCTYIGKLKNIETFLYTTFYVKQKLNYFFCLNQLFTNGISQNFEISSAVFNSSLVPELFAISILIISLFAVTTVKEAYFRDIMEGLPSFASLELLLNSFNETLSRLFNGLDNLE